MGMLYTRAFKNKWLGQPATAVGVVPASAGAVLPVRADLLRITNRTTGVLSMAVVALVKDTLWGAGQWVDATTMYTDDTVNAQDAGTDDFALETAATANDGFIVGASLPFGALSLDLTTAGAAASAVHIVEYWDGAAWTAIPANGLLVDIARAVVWPLGEWVVLFIPPVDWEVGGSGTNVPQTRYNLRVRGTPTTGTAAALARRIYVGVPLVSDILAAGAATAIASERAIRSFSLAGWAAALGLAQGTPPTGAATFEGNVLELLLN